MIDFLKTYWSEIVIILSSLASVLVCSIRRKPSTVADEIKCMISEVLPGFINLAEISGVKGTAKLMFVIDSVMKRIKAYTSSKDEQYWMSYIRDQVESMLSTPQKKGVQDEKI